MLSPIQCFLHFKGCSTQITIKFFFFVITTLITDRFFAFDISANIVGVRSFLFGFYLTAKLTFFFNFLLYKTKVLEHKKKIPFILENLYQKQINLCFFFRITDGKWRKQFLFQVFQLVEPNPFCGF